MNALALARAGYSYWEPKVYWSSHKASRDSYSYSEAAVSPAQVDEIIEDWLNQAEFVSSIDEMRLLPSYSTLIELGYAALPRIIASLSRDPSMLGIAAADITGENPVTEEIRGDVRAMAGAWIGWYQRAKQDRF